MKRATALFGVLALVGGAAWAASGQAPEKPVAGPTSTYATLRVVGDAPPDAAGTGAAQGGAARQPVAERRILLRKDDPDFKEIERFLDVSVTPGNGVLDGFGAASKIRVNLDLNDATIRDALKQVFEQAKTAYTLDPDVPQDIRISVKARNVQLHTAVNLITEAGGVGWTLEQKLTGATSVPGSLPQAEREKRLADATASTYHVGKTITTRNLFTRVMVSGHEAVWSPSLRLSDTLLPYTLYGKEERSTFTCPHCKAQSTMVRVRQQPKCPKCSRVFQPEWQFCPADGTRRPAVPGEWRFCPACGKQVLPEKAEDRNEPTGQSGAIPPASPSGPVGERDGNLAPTAFTRTEATQRP